MKIVQQKMKMILLKMEILLLKNDDFIIKQVKLLRLARLQRIIKKYEAQFYEGFQKIKRYSLFIMIGTVSHWLAWCVVC